MSPKHHFIERSILGALSFLRDSIFADEYAAQKGFLQSIDPRIKMITFLLFILQILFTKSIIILLCLYALCFVLSYFSNIGWIFFLKRTWIFIPLFALFIAVPAMFGFFTPGEVWVAFKIGGLNVTMTRQGILGAALFVMRVTVSVSFAVLLSITTKHFELLRVLRIFKIPSVFVMIFGMCYRYIFLFVEIIENTYLAIKSRIGTSMHYQKGQRLTAWNIAHLWLRSYQMNEDVYKAMLSRGYRGEALVWDEFRTRPKDWLWLCFVCIISVLLFVLNLEVKI